MEILRSTQNDVISEVSFLRYCLEKGSLDYPQSPPWSSKDDIILF